MSQDAMIKLECTQCKQANYRSKKNKRKLKERIELKKHCKRCGGHTMHKESK